MSWLYQYNKIHTLMLFLFVFVLSSCSSSINKGHPSSGLTLSIVSEMNANITVDTSKKLTGYASGVYLFHFFKLSGDSKYADDIDYGDGKPGLLTKLFSITNEVKAAASYNAIRTSNADVLISPQYVIETNNWNPLYKQIKVKVTGYPGKIISIKNKL